MPYVGRLGLLSRLALLASCILFAVPAHAQTPAQTQPPSRAKTTVVFLAGAATGLGIHEAGHVALGAALGANPRIRGLDYGPIPFFVIRHDPVSSRREYAISSAGFWMQHAGSEWLLTERPNLRQESAPFAKGVLAFHLGASALYGIAAFARVGPPERDTRGMAISLGKDGVPEPVIGVLVLAPAALDAYRYARPDSRWAAWASRGAKIAVVALTMAAGR
jgi:hypothetical protein